VCIDEVRVIEKLGDSQLGEGRVVFGRDGEDDTPEGFRETRKLEVEPRT
jgi:hypothetical protein